ncbi:MAG: hypothetical protein M1828_001847 [Chrysothrix sp. TS-e1954]|nr:MAG: hypothetical protein M1828_001847 [Chrysothrix sp. TS-e1954]
MPSTRASHSRQRTAQALQVKKAAAYQRAVKRGVRSRAKSAKTKTKTATTPKPKTKDASPISGTVESPDTTAGAKEQSEVEGDGEDSHSGDQPEVVAPSTELAEGEKAPVVQTSTLKDVDSNEQCAANTQWAGLSEEKRHDIEIQGVLGLQYHADGYSTRSGSPVSDCEVAEDDDDYEAVDSVSVADESDDGIEKDAEAYFEEVGNEMINQDEIDWNNEDTFGFMDLPFNAGPLPDDGPPVDAESFLPRFMNDVAPVETGVADRSATDISMNTPDWPSSTTDSRGTDSPRHKSRAASVDWNMVSGTQTPIAHSPHTRSMKCHSLGDTDVEELPKQAVDTPHLTLTRQNSSETQSSCSSRRKPKKRRLLKMRKFTLSPDKPLAVRKRAVGGSTTMHFKFPKGVTVKWASAKRRFRKTAGSLGFSPLSSPFSSFSTDDLISACRANGATFDLTNLNISTMTDQSLLLGPQDDVDYDGQSQTGLNQDDVHMHKYVDLSMCEDDGQDEAASALREHDQAIRSLPALDTSFSALSRSRKRRHDALLFTEPESTSGLLETFQDETLAEGLDKKGMKIYDATSGPALSTQSSPGPLTSVPLAHQQRSESISFFAPSMPSPSRKRRATASDSVNTTSPNKRARFGMSLEADF